CTGSFALRQFAIDTDFETELDLDIFLPGIERMFEQTHSANAARIDIEFCGNCSELDRCVFGILQRQDEVNDFEPGVVHIAFTEAARYAARYAVAVASL